MTEQHKEIIIKALASQIILTEQAITKGRDLIAGMKQHELAEYIWQEIAVHAQLTTLRIKEAEVYREVYDFLSEGDAE